MRVCIITVFICWFLTGCASTAIYRAFSEINNEPIKEVKSSVVTKDGSYRICVEGKLRKEGFGQYQIYISQEQASHSGFRCRNNRASNYGGRYICTEYTIPNVRAKNEEIRLGCDTPDKNPDSVFTASVIGKDRRTIIIKDEKEQDVAEVFVAEVWEGTNPMVYVFLPFTGAFDAVTSPLQLLVGLATGLGR